MPPLKAVILDSCPCDAACVFFLVLFLMKAQRALGALSMVKCLSESKTEKTLYLSTEFGGLITTSAAQLLGLDSVTLSRPISNADCHFKRF